MTRSWVLCLAIACAVAACKTAQKATKEADPVVEAEPVRAAASAQMAPAPQTFPAQLPPVPPLPKTPKGLPDAVEPKDNPTTPEKVSLGQQLFFDKRMSKDGSAACESCHHIEKAYSEGQAVSPRVGGAMNVRNAPSLLNLAYHSSYDWDGRMPTLEAVCNAEWKAQLEADPAVIAAQLNQLSSYSAQFQRAFGGPATAENIPLALAAFLRVLKAGSSPWDRHEAGDAKAVGKEVEKGWELFQSKGCTQCHVPPLFSDFDFHNVGVGLDRPEDQRDPGRTDATRDPKDRGRFKTPSLRNVAMTAPYFHDGSAATLEAAIDFMAAGGRKNPNKDPKLRRQKLSKKEKAQLQAFLESLTGQMTFTTPPELLQ